MRSVHKYKAKIDDVILVPMPSGADILRVDMQQEGDAVCVWALVDPDCPYVHSRKIRIAGTGHPIEDSYMKYINTFTCMDKKLWFHAFEIL